MKVTVNKAKCVAAGQCCLKSPLVFDQAEDDGVVILLKEYPPAVLFENVRLASKLCPTHAITLEE